MATQAYKVETLILQDEANTEVEVRPLPIAPLRRFMDAWNFVDKIGDNDDATPIFINCCGIALEKNFKGKFDALRASAAEQKKGEFLAPDYKEFLEENLDMETIYVIMEVAGGIKLNDPKLREAALAAVANQ